MTPIAHFSRALEGAMRDNPSNILDCLPALRLYARAMSATPREGDELIAAFLTREEARGQPRIVAGDVFVSALVVLAAFIRETVLGDAMNEVDGVNQTMVALRQLPRHHRDDLIVVRLFGLRYWQAALVCGCPIGTMKSRLNCAMSAFAVSCTTIDCIHPSTKDDASLHTHPRAFH